MEMHAVTSKSGTLAPRNQVLIFGLQPGETYGPAFATAIRLASTVIGR